MNAPWDTLYPAHVSADLPTTHETLIDRWQARVQRSPSDVAIKYFDGSLSAQELDQESDALAVAMAERGTGPGDRVGIYLQNIPQYPITLLALWKIGAVALILNPMYQGKELRRLVDDSKAIGFICAAEDLAAVETTLHDSSVQWTITTTPTDYQSRNDPRVFGDASFSEPKRENDMRLLIARFLGRRPDVADIDPSNVALLTYTSGTTGPPKGAMNTHGNLLAVIDSYANWINLEPGDVVFAMAPLFHITGAVVNGAIALMNDASLVLVNRFRPDVAIDAFLEHEVTFTIGSITAFNAIYQLKEASARHFSSFKSLYSGGAPIPPATLKKFKERFGIYIHNVYGMTETSSAVIAVPLGSEAPVDSASGTLSIGVPLPGLHVRVLGSDGKPVPCGQPGELEVRGPQVVPGYWENEEATKYTMPNGHLRTGDGAIMDEDGWIYLVDRLKDQINTSGYKVWPREVEDVLYQHPAVHEAAVVGHPDEYRGEAVVAYVSLRAGEDVTPADLIGFCREQLAAYKCPREVFVLPDLPKTQTGKIRRNVLRDRDRRDEPSR